MHQVEVNKRIANSNTSGMAATGLAHEMIATITTHDIARIQEALEFIPADDYSTWLKVGMSLHSTRHPRAFEFWDQWSQRSEAKYNHGECVRKWDSFKSHGTSIGTIFFIARQYGHNTGRKEIYYEPGKLNQTLREAENAILSDPGNGVLLRQGVNTLMRVATVAPPSMFRADDPDGEVPVVPMLIQHTMQTISQRLDESAQFSKWMKSTESWSPIKQPDEIKANLLDYANTATPTCHGLIGHPIVLENGDLLFEQGLGPTTGLYLHNERALEVSVPKKISLDDAKVALDYIDRTLFSEFVFEETIHREAALVAVLTSVQRRVIDKAPAFLINASMQGSGKTTLGAMLHAMLLGSEMPVATLPESNGELKKVITTLLMRSLEMIVFDNVPDGSTLDSSTLSSVITNPSYQDRTLGSNLHVELATTATFVFTGNNITVSSDLARRVIDIHLTSNVEHPEQRRFEHRDVVQWILDNRNDLMSAALTVVAGFCQAIARKERAAMNIGNKAIDSGMVFLDRYARFPAMWCGREDILKIFDYNRAQSSEEQAKKSLLLVLREIFGENQFSAADVVQLHNGEFSERLRRGGMNEIDTAHRDKLRVVIDSYYPMKIRSARSFSSVLKTLVGVVLDGHRLRKDIDTAKITVFKVTPVQPIAKPEPVAMVEEWDFL